MLSDPASNGDSLFDVNKGGRIMAAILATTVPALIVVALRAYVRVFMLHHIDQSDYVMAVALLLTLVGGALSIVSVIHGTGRHIVYVARDDIVDALFYFFLAECFYLWTIGLAKISIGLALLPLTLKALYKRSIWMIIVSMLIYTTVRFFTIIFQCTKIESSWDPWVRSHCYSRKVSQALMYSYSAFNVVTDLIFAILPFFMIRNLKLDNHVRASLAIIFSLGLFTCAAGCIKFVYIYVYGDSKDFLWEITELSIWVVVECNVAIIAGSLPMLKPLYRRLVKYTSFSSTLGKVTRTRSGAEDLDLQSLTRTQTNFQADAFGSLGDKGKIRKFSYPTSSAGSAHGGGSGVSDGDILSLESGGLGITRTTDIKVFYS